VASIEVEVEGLQEFIMSPILVNNDDEMRSLLDIKNQCQTTFNVTQESLKQTRMRKEIVEADVATQNKVLDKDVVPVVGGSK
jgi:hypothetical protein